MGLHFLTKRCLRRNAGDITPARAVSSSGEVEWIVRADMRDVVFGPQAPDWSALSDCDQASLVESGYLRHVWRVRFGASELFAKVSRISGLRGRIKSLLLGTPAEREWRVAMAAAIRDVPLPEIVALGVGSGSTPESVLLTRAIPNASTLTDVWQHSMTCEADPTGRRGHATLIQVAASLLRQAHQAGFTHRDGHPNNILISQPENGSAPRASYVDTLGARLSSRSVDTVAAAFSLAQLDQHFHRVASRTERLRFLRAYLEHDDGTGQGMVARQQRRGLVSLIGQQRKGIADSLARVRDRRLSRNNKYFASLRLTGGWRATVALRLERRHIFPEAHVPDRTPEEWRHLLGTTLVTLRHGNKRATSLADHKVEIEYRDHVGFLRKLTATLRPTRHRRAFEDCHRMRHRDVHRALLLGYAEHRSHGLVDASVLIRPQAPSVTPEVSRRGGHEGTGAA